MSKKGQGISMNVIIIAALALLVLVVLSIIFLGRTGSWSKDTVNCVQNGGTCADSCDSTQGFSAYPAWKSSCVDEGTGDMCCIKVT